MNARRFRLKESLGGDLELAPLRLLGGFICVDTHLGCQGCPWCLNRRYGSLGLVLDRKIQRDYAEVGFGPARLAELMSRLPAFTRARVPLRLGHLTDLGFEAEGIRELLERIDPEYPALLMTRLALDPRLRDLAVERRHLLVHLTITPDGQGDGGRRVLEAVAGLDGSRLFVRLSPLFAGAEAHVERTMELLPPGTAVGFGDLKVNGIPGAEHFAAMPPAQIARLEGHALERGLAPYAYFGCRLRSLLGKPFALRAEAAARSPATCARCPNRRNCEEARPPEVSALLEEARRLGFEPREAKVEGARAEVVVEAQAARADEVYLSEFFACDVKLSTVARAESRGVVAVEREVFERWERTGFYPVAELEEAGRRMAALCGL
jgi:hypothetical protein